MWPAYRTGRGLDLLLSLFRMRRHQPILLLFFWLLMGIDVLPLGVLPPSVGVCLSVFDSLKMGT